MHINPIRMGLSIIYFKRLQVRISKYIAFLSLIIVLTSAKSVDPDEMPHSVAFHLGLHCLQNYPFSKGLNKPILLPEQVLKM